MENKTLIIVIVVAVVVLGLPILANLAGEKQAAQPAASDTEKAPAAGNTEPPKPSAPQQAPQQPMAAAPMNVGNTTWTIDHPQYGNVTVQFLGDGSLQAKSSKFPMQIQGTWKQNGNNITISTSMGGMSGQVNGEQIMVEGQAARRVR